MKMLSAILVVCILLLSNLSEAGAIMGCSDPNVTKITTPAENEVNVKPPARPSMVLTAPDADTETSKTRFSKSASKSSESKTVSKNEKSSIYKKIETESFFEKEARETYSSPWIDILTSGVGSGMLTYGLTADNNAMSIGGGIVLLCGARGFRDHGWLKLASILGFGAVGISLGEDHNKRVREDRERQARIDSGDHKPPPPRPYPSISVNPSYSPSNNAIGLNMSVSY